MLRTLVKKYPNRSQRILEIIPGVFSWSLILFPIWGSLIVPELVAYYVIAFAVYWLYRSIILAILSVISHFKIKAASSYDWIQDLKKNYPDKWKKIHHLIVIPTYKEPIHILERTLTALSRQTFPRENIHIMLSFEEREGPTAKKKAKKLLSKYRHIFGTITATYHPADIEGEIKGKSSNTAWGARKATKILLKEKKLNRDKITITSEDADACFHPSYFANLTYKMLSSDNPYNHVWQGGVVFYNNIWDVPAPVRVMASIFSVTQMYILMRKDRLVNFSTYSTTLKHVISIDYWDTDVIPEDYRFFFKSYFAKKGKFTVEPIFLPIYADAPQSNSMVATLKNQYKQLKRWAWGVSDDAYIIKQYILAKDIPFFKKTTRVFHVIQDHFLWPVNWFAITISASLPPLINKKFNRVTIGKTLPQVISSILFISLISMLVIFIIDANNRPKKQNRNLLSYIFQPLEFLLLPIVGFFFSALPGIDAHTRLMLGKYIEYKVTKKV